MNMDRSSIQEKIHRLVDALVNIRDDTGKFLLKLDDGRIIDTKGWNGWEWTHGVGLYGLLQYHQITGDPKILQIMLDWFSTHLPHGTTKNVNTMSPFLCAAYLHEQKLADYTSQLDEWAEWVMRDMPRTEEGGLQHITYSQENAQQLWDDTLMMCVLPLAKIGLIFDRPGYVEEAKRQFLEEAKRQFLLHVKYLVDTHTGLWYHGWTFDGRHNFAKALWGRGNCWITIAIPDFISLLSLPPSDPLHSFLTHTLLSQIDALVRYQDHKTGLWHTIINDPSTYLEASASAGFAYGILKALRLDLVPESKINLYTAAANAAIRGVLANINTAGELEKTSFGTPVFDTVVEYNEVPITTMPYGQSLALLALTEFLRCIP